MEKLAVLHLLNAYKTMIYICQCVSYLGLFFITDLKYWMSYTILQYWHTVCQISDTHILCVCHCIVHLGVVVSELGI